MYSNQNLNVYMYQIFVGPDLNSPKKSYRSKIWTSSSLHPYYSRAVGIMLYESRRLRWTATGKWLKNRRARPTAVRRCSSASWRSPNFNSKLIRRQDVYSLQAGKKRRSREVKPCLLWIVNFRVINADLWILQNVFDRPPELLTMCLSDHIEVLSIMWFYSFGLLIWGRWMWKYD